MNGSQLSPPGSRRETLERDFSLHWPLTSCLDLGWLSQPSEPLVLWKPGGGQAASPGGSGRAAVDTPRTIHTQHAWVPFSVTELLHTVQWVGSRRFLLAASCGEAGKSGLWEGSLVQALGFGWWVREGLAVWVVVTAGAAGRKRSIWGSVRWKVAWQPCVWTHPGSLALDCRAVSPSFLYQPLFPFLSLLQLLASADPLFLPLPVSLLPGSQASLFFSLLFPETGPLSFSLVSPGLKPCFLLQSSCPLTKTQLAEGVLSDSRKAGSWLASQRPHETAWPGPWPSSTWCRQGCLYSVGSPMPLSRTRLLWQSDHKQAGVQGTWIQSRGMGLDPFFLWIMVRPLQGLSRVDKILFGHPHPDLSSWTHALFCPLLPLFLGFHW